MRMDHFRFRMLVDEKAEAVASGRRKYGLQKSAREAAEAAPIPPRRPVDADVHQRHSLMLFPTPLSVPTASPSAQELSIRKIQNNTGSRAIMRPDRARKEALRIVSTSGSNGVLVR